MSITLLIFIIRFIKFLIYGFLQFDSNKSLISNKPIGQASILNNAEENQTTKRRNK